MMRPPAASSPHQAGQKRFGFNHNFGYAGRQYHIQTEDSGLDRAHIYTQVFCGGTVIVSRKLVYDPDWPEVRARVRQMMKASHRAMVMALAAGELDSQIEERLGSVKVESRRRSNPRTSLVVPTRGRARSRPASDPAEAASEATPAAETPSDEIASFEFDTEQVDETLAALQDELESVMGVALVDSDSGMALCTLGSGIDFQLAAAGQAEVYAAQIEVMKALDLDATVEDLLVTLDQQFHLLRPVGQAVFLYVAIDRARGNLAMARLAMARAGARLEIDA